MAPGAPPCENGFYGRLWLWRVLFPSGAYRATRCGQLLPNRCGAAQQLPSGSCGRGKACEHYTRMQGIGVDAVQPFWYNLPARSVVPFARACFMRAGLGAHIYAQSAKQKGLEMKVLLLKDVY